MKLMGEEPVLCRDDMARCLTAETSAPRLPLLPEKMSTQPASAAAGSGGGLRTVYLGGLDDRIHCACCVGMMTTWRDYLLNKCHTHTWMIYIPVCRTISTILNPGPASAAADLCAQRHGDQLFTIGENAACRRYAR